MFCHTCLGADDGAHLVEQKFVSFRGSLVGHRWGYLLSTCQEVAELECALRLHWNTKKLTGRERGVGADGAAEVGEIITNDKIDKAAAFVVTRALVIPPHAHSPR